MVLAVLATRFRTFCAKNTNFRKCTCGTMASSVVPVLLAAAAVLAGAAVFWVQSLLEPVHPRVDWAPLASSAAATASSDKVRSALPLCARSPSSTTGPACGTRPAS